MQKSHISVIGLNLGSGGYPTAVASFERLQEFRISLRQRPRLTAQVRGALAGGGARLGELRCAGPVGRQRREYDDELPYGRCSGVGFPNADDFYPAIAKAINEQGSARINVCVDAQGRLTAEPTIVAGTNSRHLDAGALQLARAGSGHYRPTLEDGRPVDSCYSFRVRFRCRATVSQGCAKYPPYGSLPYALSFWSGTCLPLRASTCARPTEPSLPNRCRRFQRASLSDS